MIECDKYTTDEQCGVHMAINKIDNDIIVDARKMIHKCLSCNFFKKEICKQTAEMVTFLEYNNWQHDWK